MLERRIMEETNKQITSQEVKNKNDYSSRKLWWPIGIGLIAIILVCLLVGAAFHRRTMVARSFHSGFRRGEFAGQQFGRMGMMGYSRHAILGAVNKIDGNTVTITQNGQDVAVTIASDTSIYKSGSIAKQSDIHVGDVIIVRGAPGSDGTIAARTITIN